ncbi:MAG TPA: hypothetical protein VLF79_01500 [Candidatus Saccharimonadales bacterium]|nr:hypothetical protein [Candidatus Saccharimonadales bacterium]
MRKVFKTQLHKPYFWILIASSVVFISSLVLRIAYASHGMDQGDTVLYKNSLVDMHFYRENQWPLLLFFQKVLWLIFPSFSPQYILSLSNIILAAATLTLLFILTYQVTKSYLSSLGIAIIVFFMPLFAVYTVTGMQDMAQTFAVTCFLAAIFQFCLSQKLIWIYVSSFISGLFLGVRLTLILTLPSLVIAMILTRQITLRSYINAVAALIAGAFLGLVGDVFITPMANSDPKGFFLSQFHMFNPSVIGYWTKAGDYTLFTGYRHTLFFWVPIIWVAIYLAMKLRKDKISIAPIVALVAALISLLVAYGLLLILGTFNLRSTFVIEGMIISALLLYELISFILKGYFGRNNYIREIDFREKTIYVLSTLVLSYIVFNYIFAGSVTRYLLPIVPAVIILILVMLAKTGWKSIAIVILGLIVAYWGCSFGQAQADITVFKQLDTRSATSEYIKSHDGIYYDFEATGSLLGYLKSYNLEKRLHVYPEQNCSELNFDHPNYIILYGDEIPQVVRDCQHLTWKRVAKFKRHEVIIEDSVGNIGFTIYKILPKL